MDEKKVGEEIKGLRRIEREYLKTVGFRISQKDIHHEYQKRVRDRDPKITNVTIVRVLKISQPSGPGWDEKLIELATLIKEGASFEEAEAQYPSRYREKYQKDRWVPLDSLPHTIDSKTVKAGDIYGLEKILNHEAYYDPMVKIYEVRHLEQVRLSDRIYTSEALDIVGGPGYLWIYLRDKARERKRHVLMSQLWADFSIAEDGKPIQRVGIYQPCTGF